ncbi:MAG: hypothetical protein ACLUEK_03735 [Oscillospiraceae bacterium]
MEYPRFFRLCWDNLLTLIGLNLLFLICCVPLVTLPAALTALAGGLVRPCSRARAARCGAFCGCSGGSSSGDARGACHAAARGRGGLGLPLFTGALPGCCRRCSVFCLVCAYIVFCAGRTA